MKKPRLLLLVTGFCVMPACASFDAQDRYVLGDANRANIAAQSDRDTSLSNSKRVDSASGVRAVNAVKALNEGETKKLAVTGTGGAE